MKKTWNKNNVQSFNKVGDKKMGCKVVKNMLSEFIDDELAPEQKEAVKLHLQGCAACRMEVEELGAVHGLFASAERFSAPYGFSTRVMANLEEVRESIWSRLFARPVFVKAIEVAFAIIIVVIGLVSGNMLTAQRSAEGLTSASAEVRQSFALDSFEAAPSGSIGGVYVSMTGVR
jgi:anti-sigma factor RsiW